MSASTSHPEPRFRGARFITTVFLMVGAASCGDSSTQPTHTGLRSSGDQASFAQTAQDLRITPATDTILIGQNVDLTVAPTSGAPINKQPTWTSSDTTIAKVVATGLTTARVTGRRTGVVTITAVSGQRQGTNMTTVVPVPVRSVSISPDTISIQLPDSVQYTATARDSVGNVLTGRAVTWSIADTSVARISAGGIVRARARGTTRVLATVEGVVGSSTGLRVQVPELSMTLSLSQDSANVGDTLVVPFVASLGGDPIGPDSVVVRIGLRTVAGVVVTAVRQRVARPGVPGPVAGVVRIFLSSTIAIGNYTVVGYIDCRDVAGSTNEAVLTGCLATPLTAGSVPESNENDNSAAANVVVRGPDLVAVGISAPDSIFTRMQATTSIQIVNTGSATGAGFNVISALYDATAGTYPVAIAAVLGGMGSRETRSIPFLFGVPAGLDPTHSYQIVAYADCSSAGGTAAARIAACIASPASAGVIAESNENNNLARRGVALASNIVRVVVTPDSVALNNVGDTTSFVARAFDRAGNVVLAATTAWTSLDPSVADILVPSKVIARGPGRGRIVATSDGFADTSIVKVPLAPARVVVSPDAVVFTAVGDTARLTATVYDANNNVMPGATVTWSVSEPIVAGVSTTGLVTARATGLTPVIASSGGRADTASISVYSKVTRIDISPDSAVVEAILPSGGFTTQMYAVSYDKNGHVVDGAWVTWQSLDPAIATISEHGLVAGHANGQARITATNYADGVADTVWVTVWQRPVYIEVAPETTYVAEGGTATLTPTLRDSLGTLITDPRPVTWTSLDPTIATVSGTSVGQVIGVRAGTARIVGSIEWRSDTVVVVVSPANSSLSVGARELQNARHPGERAVRKPDDGPSSFKDD